ncbi:Tubby- protein 1, partial [Podila epigama]
MDQREEQDRIDQQTESGAGSSSTATATAANRPYVREALVQPTPSPLPEAYIVNQRTTITPHFSFGSKLDLLSPKLLHDTVMSPVPQGKKFMCRIVRKNEGMDRRMYPTYELSLEEPIREQTVFLLRATKKKRSRGSYYAITSDMDNICDYDRKATDENYGVLGKLRSNFLGTAFNVYSNGRNPFSGTDANHSNHASPNNSSLGGAGTTSPDSDKRKQKKEVKNKDLPVRQELGAVIYSPNVLGLKGPRKMTILMNTMTMDGEMVERRPTQVKDTLIGRYTDGDMTDLLVLKNKSPQWND